MTCSQRWGGRMIKTCRWISLPRNKTACTKPRGVCPLWYLHGMGLWIILTQSHNSKHTSPAGRCQPLGLLPKRMAAIGTANVHVPQPREQPAPSGPNYLPLNWRTGIHFWLQTLPSPLFTVLQIVKNKERYQQCNGRLYAEFDAI